MKLPFPVFSCTAVVSLLALTALAVPLYSQTTVTTTPVGYVTQSFPTNSDTFIVPQLQRPSEFAGTVSSVSLLTNGTATLSLAGSLLTANAFQYVSGTQPKTYYALVTAGNLIGTYFTIVSNAVNTITISHDGLTPSSSDITAVECRPYWTLNTLFPPSDANVSFVPSASHLGGTRRTQIMIPDFSGSGINRAAARTFFYNNNVADWVSTSATSVKAGDTIIPPDQYLILRNTGGTPRVLTQTVAGSVVVSPFATYLSTEIISTNNRTGQNDNFLGFPRATDYKLSQLGFTDTNFVQSTSTSIGGRRDTLLVYSTTGSGFNRAASKTYFRFSGSWYDTVNTLTPVDPVIPAGSALCVRKFASTNRFDSPLTNLSNASL
jgi:uncharacterized protein (TIGR02597 family)